MGPQAQPRIGVKRLKAATSDWLSVDFGRTYGEVAHDSAARVFFVEPFLGNGPDPPEDFKGFVFDGRIAFWQVDLGRFGDRSRSFFDPVGQHMDMAIHYPPAGPVPAPKNLETMNRIAGDLGEGLDFVRIDLFNVDGEVFFGELTPFPASGLRVLSPPGTDLSVGKLWRLPSLGETR